MIYLKNLINNKLCRDTISFNKIPSKGAKMKIKSLALMLLGVSAYAHFGMVVPSNSTVDDEKEANLQITYKFSHPFEGDMMNLTLPNEAGVFINGKKEAIKPYLSNGDAKFTQPEKAQVTSTILEKISLNDDGETYNVTYVIGLRSDNSTVSSERISFNIKEDEQSLMKWVVTSEPLREPFSSTNDKVN